MVARWIARLLLVRSLWSGLYQFHLIESYIRLPFLSLSKATVIHGVVGSNWYKEVNNYDQRKHLQGY